MSTSDHPPSAPGGSGAPTASYSILKFIVIFLGILLVLGFAVVVGTIIYRLAKSDSGPLAENRIGAPGAPRVVALLEEIEITLPAGSEISGHDLDGSRLALRLSGPGGPEIWIVDLASGEVTSRVRFPDR